MKHVFQHPPETPSPTGRKYWRSLDELNDTPEFRGWLAREFPAGIEELEMDGLSRRSFLQLMGGSLALAGFGLSGCRRPEAVLVPFAKSAEWTIPGNNLLYATSMPRRNGALPLIVTTTDGRPIKNEGNPLHPVSNGGTDTYAQASILELYDPERSQTFLLDGKMSDAGSFADWITTLRAEAKADGGASLAILTGESMSPSRERLRAELQQQFPKMTWCVYEPLSNDNEREATKAAFGSAAMKVTPKFGQADIILSLDSDFLCIEEGGLAATRDFSNRRRVAASTDAMNRLYAVENRYTITGGMADHRLRCPASQIGAVAVALAKAVADATGSGPLTEMLSTVPATEVQKLEKSLPWITEAAKDLVAHPGKSLVVVGANQPGWVHALGFAINGALGSFGATLTAIATAAPVGVSLAALAEKMKAGAVKTLFVVGGNPVYNAPTDLNWPELQKKVATVVRLGLVRGRNLGRREMACPGRALSRELGRRSFLRRHLRRGAADDPAAATAACRSSTCWPRWPAARRWTARKSSRKPSRRSPGMSPTRRWPGTLSCARASSPNSAAPEANATFNAGAAKAYLQSNFKSAPVPTADAWEVVLTPDYCVWDGRYTNNGWLQELPDPVTKLTWDNAALMNPAMATKLGLAWKEEEIRDGQGPGLEGNWIEIAVGDRKLKVAVLIDPGHVDHSISLSLGYGREVVGRVGKYTGVNAYPLRSSAAPYFVSGAKVTKLPEAPYVFSTTQQHYNMEGRALVRELPLETYREHPGFGEDGRSFVQKFGMDAHIPPNATIYQHPPLDAQQQWGMAIDLNTCIGLQRLRGGLPEREQHSDRRARAGPPRPRDALDPDGPLLFLGHAGGRGSAGDDAAGGLPALRDRAVRNGLPGERDRAQRGGPQRDGLQPLHRHALLREQLPVQGAPLQLFRLQQAPARQAAAGARSPRRAWPRRSSSRRIRTSRSACAA